MKTLVAASLLPIALALPVSLQAARPSQPENGPEVKTTTPAPIGPAGIITLVAGNGYIGDTGNGGLGTKAQLVYPQGVAVDSAGNVYIADQYAAVVRKVAAATGIITNYAGTGFGGYSGDGGLATKAQLDEPLGLALDAAGDLYIADSRNNVIRKVNAKTGIITTVAGDGEGAGAGDADPCPNRGADGVPAINFPLCAPTSVAVDSLGNLMILDSYLYSVVHEVNAKTGIIAKVAGSGSGYAGDGGLAVNAKMNQPTQVAVDSSNNLYIADLYNCAIRKVTAATGIITSLVGTPAASGYGGACGFTSDAGPVSKAQIGYSGGVAVDKNGNVYIADQEYDVVHLITSVPVPPADEPRREADASHPDAATQLNIYTVVGAYKTEYGFVATSIGFSGYGGPAAEAELDQPGQLTVDGNGNLYGADPDNAMVYKVEGAATLPTTAPVISPAGQEYLGSLTVTIAPQLPGSTTYYTLDSTVPNTNSTKYTAPLVLNNYGIAVVTAFSVKNGVAAVPEGGTSTAQATPAEQFTFLAAPDPPTFSPVSGSTVTPMQHITLKAAPYACGSMCETDFFYTFGDTDPRTTSPMGGRSQYSQYLYVGQAGTLGSSITVNAATAIIVNFNHNNAVGAWSVGYSSATYYVKTAATVTTEAASGVDASGVHLRGTVNPNSAATEYWIAYGESRDALNGATPRQALPAGHEPVKVSALLSGLKARTTYYYQVVASNEEGTAKGAVMSFTTP